MNFELVQGTLRYKIDNEYLYVRPSEPINVHLKFKSGLYYEVWDATSRSWLPGDDALDEKYVDAVEAFMREEDSSEKKGSV